MSENGKVFNTDIHQAKTNMSELISINKNPYILKSLIYQLLDSLICLKSIIDTNPNREENMKEWREEISLIINGIISQDTNGNYYCDQYLLDRNRVESNGYKVGDKIQILETDHNRNQISKQLYPNFARKFK